MKQDPNELRVVVENKSIKVGGFSSWEQLCVFVVGWCYTSEIFYRFCMCLFIYKNLSESYSQKNVPSNNSRVHRQPHVVLCAYVYFSRWNNFSWTVSSIRADLHLQPLWARLEGRGSRTRHTHTLLWGLKAIFRFAPPSCAAVYMCTCD